MMQPRPPLDETEAPAPIDGAQFRAVIDNLSLGIIVMDPESQMLYWNQAARAMHGFVSSEAAKRTLQSLPGIFEVSTLEGTVLDLEDWPVARLIRGDSIEHVKLRVRRWESNWSRVFKYSGAQVSCAGNKSMAFLVMEDITHQSIAEEARMLAEAEVRRLNAELERRVVERTAQLEAANGDLEAFSYSVSHDLRAPLRTVNGYAEIILTDFAPQLPEEARRLLQRIRSRGLYMGVMIDNLLEFSRLGRKPLNQREVDMRSLVEGVLRGFAPHLEDRRVEFKVGDLRPCLGDMALLRQVWMNLLSNALKYSRGRAPAIIEIGSATQNGDPVYFVRDNGVGFNMQFAHKLFGVFQRLHLTDEFEGTGVGLAIVQRIVERHGGSVSAVGQEQHGATFSFSMPHPRTA